MAVAVDDASAATPGIRVSGDSRPAQVMQRALSRGILQSDSQSELQASQHACVCAWTVSGRRDCIRGGNVWFGACAIVQRQPKVVIESKRGAIGKGLVHELLYAQDAVLCSYFAQREGATNGDEGRRNTAAEVFQGLDRFG